jgi:hypothetical protein
VPRVENEVTMLQGAVSDLKGSVSTLTEHVIQNERQHKKAMDDIMKILRNVERSTAKANSSPIETLSVDAEDAKADKTVEAYDPSSEEGGGDDNVEGDGLRVGVVHGGPAVLEQVAPLLREQSKLKSLQCNLAFDKF